MNFSSSLFFAHKYLFSPTKEPTLTLMIRFCFLGIFLATFALALVISIMKGFEKATQSTLQTIYPHIIVDGKDQHINFSAFVKKIDALHIPYKECAPRSNAQMIIINSEESLSEVVQFKAIDPVKEIHVTALQEKMMIPEKQLHLTHQEILIGKELAASLHFNKGDTAEILYTDTTQATPETSDFKKEYLTIAGIFSTGIYEFDNNMIIGNFDTFLDLYPQEGVQQIYIALQHESQEQTVIDQLKKAFPHTMIYTWKDLYPGLLASLKLETLGMSIILGLLFILAIINMIALLFIFVKIKSRDIALLHSLGMASTNIRFIFIFISIFLSSIATGIGLSTAWILGLFLQKFPLISLPEHIYYTNTLPIELNPLLFLAIFVCSIGIAIAATLLPIYSIDQKNIINTLHFDM